MWERREAGSQIKKFAQKYCYITTKKDAVIGRLELPAAVTVTSAADEEDTNKTIRKNIVEVLNSLLTT